METALPGGPAAHCQMSKGPGAPRTSHLPTLAAQGGKAVTALTAPGLTLRASPRHTSVGERPGTVPGLRPLQEAVNCWADNTEARVPNTWSGNQLCGDFNHHVRGGRWRGAGRSMSGRGGRR